MYNENLVNLIKDKFQKCLKEGGGFRPVYFPHIPAKQEEKARKHFVELRDEDETILMLFDTSLFSKGKNGLALTDRAVYFKDLMTAPRRCAYSDWRIDADDSAELLGIPETNTFLMAPFLNELLNEICTMKKYEGLFEAEDAAKREEAEAKLRDEEEAKRREDSRDAGDAEENSKSDSDGRDAGDAKENSKSDGDIRGDSDTKDGGKEDDDDDDDDDDEDFGLLNLLGVVMKVAEDPSRS